MGIRATHVCGEAEDRERASTAHAYWHWVHGQKPCGKSRAERAWRKAELKYGRTIPDWYPGWRGAPYRRGYRLAVWECGEASKAERPTNAHVKWHKKAGEVPCMKAKAEAAWRDAEKRAGRPLPDWNPNDYAPYRGGPYECGGAEDRELPGYGHLRWDLRYRGKACAKARAEARWSAAEKHYGRAIPDWYPGRKEGWWQ